MELYERALACAARAHAGVTRKTDDTPYIVHPIMVARSVEAHGFGEAAVAAALLHDVLEDTAVTADVIAEEFGTEVAALVAVVTEDTALPWEERKAAYIEQVAAGPDAAKAISIADKIHNAESLLAHLAREGRSVWERFNRGPEQKLAFERDLHAALAATWDHPLVAEYHRRITALADSV